MFGALGGLLKKSPIGMIAQNGAVGQLSGALGGPGGGALAGALGVGVDDGGNTPGMQAAPAFRDYRSGVGGNASPYDRVRPKPMNLPVQGGGGGGSLASLLSPEELRLVMEYRRNKPSTNDALARIF